VLIDAGPDFRQQLLRAGVSDLSAILLTHEHKDHIGGLDDVRALNYLSGSPVDVYAERRVLDAVRAEYSYAFVENPYPGTPEMNLHEIRCDRTFSVGRVTIVPLRVFHHRLPILGFRIGDFVYVTDANRIDQREMEKMHGCRLLVINALRKQVHLAHFSLTQALDVAQKVGAQLTLLTHISHQMGRQADVEGELPPTVAFARDGLTVEC
jgi:phosphoribosyl 1,2-cyclic phosphate phosphodiesterase